VVTVKYGTDAVRMALLQGAAPGTDIILTEERMESSRSFANKIWNAARFLFLNMERSGVEPWVPESLERFLPEPDTDTLEVPIEDRWIFSRLNACAEQVNRAIENYRYHDAAQVLWHFFWHEFCDWYIELKKQRFQENSGLNAGWRNTLAAFETALRLLHPAMPFLTEELWQRLATNRSIRPISVAVALYPQYRQEVTDYEAEREIGILQEIVTEIRTELAFAKLDANVDSKRKATAKVYGRSSEIRIALRHVETIQKLANVTDLELVEESVRPADSMPGSGHAILEGTTLKVRHSGPRFRTELEVPLADAEPHRKGMEEAQRKRQEKEKQQLVKNIASLQSQLGNEAFLAKAPAKVIDSMRQKLADYEAQLLKI